MPEQPGTFFADDSTTHRRSGVKAVGAVLAVALVPLALVVGHLPQQEAPKTAAPAAGLPTMSQKWVAIDTVSNRITLNAPSSSAPLAAQNISGTNCALNQGTTASQVVSFTGFAGPASYATGYLGVQEKKSGTGTSCSQVNAVIGESLTLTPGGATKAVLGASVLASSAYLDVDLKQGARIVATAYRGSAPVPGGVFELQSGTSISGPASSTVRQCHAGADSGSDAKAGDNCRWPISVPSWTGTDDGIYFDRLVLEAKAGAFSVLGGSDGRVPDFPTPAPAAVGGSSVLEVVDGLVGCLGQTRTLAPSADAPSVTVYRLNNVDPTGCSPTSYTLNNGPLFAQFLKPLDTQTDAQFVWDVTWRLARPVGDSTALPELKIDYENPAANPAVTTTLGWCPDSSYKTTAPFYSGYSAAQVAGLPDQDLFSPSAKQYACVISRTATATDGGSPGTADDYIAVRDLVYVLGDAKMQF